MSDLAVSQVTIPHFANPAESNFLRKAIAGDTYAFDQLIKPHRRPLHVHCYRMLGSPFDADDALQETLLAAWRGLGSFEARSAFGTWLNTIATRVCLRMISRRSRSSFKRLWRTASVHRRTGRAGAGARVAGANAGQ